MFAATPEISAVQVLKINEPATITLKFSEYSRFWQPSDSTVMDDLKSVLGSTADILSVNRGLFSSHYAITFRPLYAMTRAQWESAFTTSLTKFGFSGISIEDFQGGYESKNVGGITGALVSTAQTVGSVPVVGETLSTVKWVALAVLAVMVLPYIPRPKKRKS